MSIATTYKERYEHKDFISDYSFSMLQSYEEREKEIVTQIMRLSVSSNYETKSTLTNWKEITRDQAKNIYDFVLSNFDEFTRRMINYWVGPTELESIDFGEQEEDLSSIRNYSMKYLKSAFRKEGYYVDGNYAYYNLSGDGLFIDLLAAPELLNEFLLTI